MKFAKPFLGVRAGEIYPHAFQPGDECPAELEAAALSVDALEKPAVKAVKKAPETK